MLASQKQYSEKRDKTQLPWQIVDRSIGGKIKVAIFSDDWGTIAMTIPQIAQKLSKIEVSDHTAWAARGSDPSTN